MPDGRYRSLGYAYRQARDDQKITRRTVSERSGVVEETIYNLESGRKAPNLSTLSKLIKAANCTAIITITGPNGEKYEAKV